MRRIFFDMFRPKTRVVVSSLPLLARMIAVILVLASITISPALVAQDSTTADAGIDSTPSDVYAGASNLQAIPDLESEKRFILSTLTFVYVCQLIYAAIVALHAKDSAGQSLLSLAFGNTRAWGFVAIGVIVPIGLSTISLFGGSGRGNWSFGYNVCVTTILTLITLELSTLLDVDGAQSDIATLFRVSLAFDIFSYLAIVLGWMASSEAISATTMHFMATLTISATTSSVFIICLAKKRWTHP